MLKIGSVWAVAGLAILLGGAVSVPPGQLIEPVPFVHAVEPTSAAPALGGDVDPGKWLKSNKSKVGKLAKEWWQQRPPTHFVDWDQEHRSELLARAAALGPLPEFQADNQKASIDALIELIWKPLEKNWAAGVGTAKKGKVTFQTPYGEAWFLLSTTKSKRGEKPALILGLHGGGENAGDAAPAQNTWNTSGTVGIFPQGIHLVHDTWNTVEGERFLLTLLDYAKTSMDVDPDRIYVAGFSMGGTGSWFMAGRHTDLLACSMPCAGVLMASPKSQVASPDEIRAVQHGLIPNVRNLAMYYFIGLADTNCMPGTYLYVERMLKKLKEDDEGGYGKINFRTIEGLAHAFPPGEPAAAKEFMLQQKRDTFPEKIVWEYAADPFPQYTQGEACERLVKRDFYWLSCENPMDFQTIRAERKGNTFTVTTKGTASGLKGISVRLNAKMIDPNEDVIIIGNGVEVYRGKPEPSLADVFDSLDSRLDRSMVFDRHVTL
jgi:hypothetical protein